MAVYHSYSLCGKTMKHRAKVAARKVGHLGFDFIVCTGVSGLSFASALACEMDKDIIYIRKDRQLSHGNDIEFPHGKYGYEYDNICGNAIIVDDFIESGSTMIEISRTMSASIPDVNMVGVYLYEHPYNGCGKWPKDKIQDEKEFTDIKHCYDDVPVYHKYMRNEVTV